MDYVLVKVQHGREPGRGRVLMSECLAIDEGTTLQIVKNEVPGQRCHYELTDEQTGLMYTAECGTGEGRYDDVYTYRVQEPGFRHGAGKSQARQISHDGLRGAGITEAERNA